MLRRTWPRFVLEACFLFAVALVAGWLDLSIPVIGAVMLVAYLATAAAEFAISRAGRPRPEPAAAHPPLARAPEEEEDGFDWDDVRDEPLGRERPDAEPELEAEPEPEPEPELEPEPEPIARLPLPAEPREWNVWELERLVREENDADVARQEEWSYLLVYLRDFASPEGTLSADFDALVRESFGELLAGAAR